MYKGRERPSPSATYMSEDQMGQSSTPHHVPTRPMLHPSSTLQTPRVYLC